MFKNMDQFLQGAATLEVDVSGQLSQRDLQISTAALLLQMAHADEKLTNGEIDAMVSTMDKLFVLQGNVAGDLLEVADFLRRDQTKLDDLLKVVNKRFDAAQKQTIVAMLWKVMNADGFIDPFEANLAAEISMKLGLSVDEVKKAQSLADTAQV